jgi:transposase
MIPDRLLSRLDSGPGSGGNLKVLAVYRLPWQIELAFKRLKSLLHIDQLPTWTERGSRSWLYAHLILALLCVMTSARISWNFLH